MGVLAVAGGAATAGAPDAASDGVGDADAAVGEDVGAADEDEDPRAPTAAAVGPEPRVCCCLFALASCGGGRAGAAEGAAEGVINLAEPTRTARGSVDGDDDVEADAAADDDLVAADDGEVADADDEDADVADDGDGNENAAAADDTAGAAGNVAHLPFHRRFFFTPSSLRSDSESDETSVSRGSAAAAAGTIAAPAAAVAACVPDPPSSTRIVPSLHSGAATLASHCPSSSCPTTALTFGTKDSGASNTIRITVLAPITVLSALPQRNPPSIIPAALALRTLHASFHASDAASTWTAHIFGGFAVSSETFCSVHQFWSAANCPSGTAPANHGDFPFKTMFAPSPAMSPRSTRTCHILTGHPAAFAAEPRAGQNRSSPIFRSQGFSRTRVPPPTFAGSGDAIPSAAPPSLSVPIIALFAILAKSVASCLDCTAHCTTPKCSADPAISTFSVPNCPPSSFIASSTLLMAATVPTSVTPCTSTPLAAGSVRGASWYSQAGRPPATAGFCGISE